MTFDVLQNLGLFHQGVHVTLKARLDYFDGYCFLSRFVNGLYHETKAASTEELLKSEEFGEFCYFSVFALEFDGWDGGYFETLLN